MENDNKLKVFANDVYDVLVGNTNFCTQEEFLKRFGQDVEIDCSTNIITIGDFQIKITKKQ